MGFVQYQTRAGLNTVATPLLNEGGWSFGSGVRFFQGLLQKKGGFQSLSPQAITGTARGMVGWADLSGNPYIAIGTNERLLLFSGGLITDITPIRATNNPVPNFATVAGTPTITVTDPSNNANVGDWVNIVVPVSVGGLILQGFYQVQSVVSVSSYTITAAANATSTTAGGQVPTFQTTFASLNVTVVLPNHGLIATNIFTVQVPLAIGGFNLTGGYSVVNVIDANTFTIQPGSSATSSAGPTAENFGNAQIQYLIPSGPLSAGTATTSGYGLGVYDGGGLYGQSGTSHIPLRQWFLDHFGAFLIGNYNGSPLYLWRPGQDTNAIPINAANFPTGSQMPNQVTVSFMSAPQQILIALGCDTPGSGVFNPLLVRWCDVGDFTDWQAQSTNQAGSFPISSGSKLVGGISAPNFVALFTDIDMWLMNYLGGTGASGFVWGFNRITGSRGLLAARAVGIVGNEIFFVSPNGFFRYNGGRVQLIPCPVWDVFWTNVNLVQADKITAAPNSEFTEMTWHFPSAAGAGENDSSITVNITDNTWTVDLDPIWIRTAWIDQNVYGAPVGIDLNKAMQQAENTNDANGVAINAFAQTGWVAISEGDWVMMLERFEADLLVNGGSGRLFVTVYAKDYAVETPQSPVRAYGPYQWIVGKGPPYSIVRARGRFMSIKISSVDRGVFWRLGRMRYLTKKAGRRP